ncbi:hypothetical protein Tco_0843018 [Tanacetum coccineum]|uniref:Uncharacterized protein n=1 Tax=Tanacetum coccineum TaxID=301880 RepID=A0ABQ5B0V4_9ASTR
MLRNSRSIEVGSTSGIRAVTEASVRRDLQLDDNEGTNYLPNATIFEELTRIGTMASAIICLAINQKLNFSKYIFESMVKNLDNAGKFLMYPRLASAAIFVKMGVLQIGISAMVIENKIGIRAMVIENKVRTLTITTFLFPSKKVLRVATSSGMNDEIPPVFSSFYNNPYLKDTQAFYAKKSPIPPPDPISPPAILTPSPVLPPSLLFDPRYFFVPEELLPPKKKIHPLSSSSTTLSNSSRKQAYILATPFFSTYSYPIYELGKSSIKMHVEHHEKQIEGILNYLEELSFHYIEKMKERLVNDWIIIPRDFDEVKTKLKEARAQILELQKKHMGQRDKIAFVHFRISDLEMNLEDIQVSCQHSLRQESHPHSYRR